MIHIVMPQMGESLAEGTVVRWLKRPGDRVERDEPLFEISTDKVDTDVPSPSAGVLKEILVPEGRTVAVGAPVAVIESAEALAAERPSVDSSGTKSPPESSVGARASSEGAREEPGAHFRSAHAAQLVSFRRGGTVPGPGAGGSEGDHRSTFSPAVLEAARRGGLSLETLTTLQGSGRGGRLTKRDVADYLGSRAGSAIASPQSPIPDPRSPIPNEYLYRPTPEDRRMAMSPARRKLAHHMSWSTRISPHATAFGECDMSRATTLLDREREAFARAAGAPLTYTALAARSAVRALTEFPALNASVVGDEVILKPRVHLGVAVALPDTDDLIVPVIRSADELSLEGLARAIADLATRARERRLRAEDVQGGTFTLTNPGMFGGLGGTPILNQPQVAILGLGAIVKRAVVVNDAIAIRPMMTLALTFDHRALDGMLAFRFLERVRRLLEEQPMDPSAHDGGAKAPRY